MVAGHRELPHANEFSIVRKFITTAEHSELLRWAEEQFAGNHLKGTSNNGDFSSDRSSARRDDDFDS